jgi:ParB/RepB/Spo0J family partition protein
MANTATKRPARKRAAAPKSPPATESAEKLPPAVARGKTRLMDVPLALIEPEPDFNPRKSMDQGELAELAESVKQHGLLQPVLLRPRDRGGPSGAPRFWLTGGHRRHAAAVIAGEKTIPAIIREDGDALIAAVLDNSHRKDLTLLEEAQVYERAMKTKGLTVSGVPKVLSVPQRRVTERLRILVLPENAQQALGEGKIGPSHVAWLGELAEKSVLLASVITQHMLETGHVPDAWQLANHVIPSTKGVIAPGQIKAGSAAFKLNRKEVKEAVDELASIENKYSGPEYSWRYGPGRNYPSIATGDMVRGPADWLEEGVAIGAVLKIHTPAMRDDDRGAYAIIDQRWLQATLEEQFLKAHQSLNEFRKRSKAAQKNSTGSSRGGGSELTATEANAAEKARKKAEREQALRDREKATEANRRLGKLLMHEFASVELTLDVAKAICMTPMHEASQYGAPNQSNVAGLASSGMRYLDLPEFAATRELRGKTVPCLMTGDKQLTEAFWSWWKKAKTPNEVIGRTLIALLATHYADRRQAMSAEHDYHGFSIPTEAKRTLEKILPPKKARQKGALTDSTAHESGIATGGEPNQEARPLAEVLTEEPAAAAAVELTEPEQKVLAALYKRRNGSRYACNGEREANQNILADTGLGTMKAVKEAMEGLRAKRLVGGVKAAPYLNKAYEELAKTVSEAIAA